MADGIKTAAKSGLSKEELRRLMKEKTTKKIDSPLAKYDNAGQLFCIPCKSHVKNEASWTAHVNGRLHQQTLAASRNPAKSKPSIPAQITSKSPETKSTVSVGMEIFKTPVIPPLVATAKRPIDCSTSVTSVKKSKSFVREVIAYPNDAEMEDIPETGKSTLPTDFFDSSESPTPPHATKDAAKKVDDSAGPLPDDFFDNPTKNIKQKQEREKQKEEEEEWNKFQKAMHEESHKSAMVVEQDDEQTRHDKEMHEIESQMERWRKIHDLELKKDDLRSKIVGKDGQERMRDISENSDDDEEDDLELMDWRKRNLW